MSLSDEIDANSLVNLALLDPPRWGWCAAGGIIDLCPPVEAARRLDAKTEYLKRYRETVKSIPSKITKDPSTAKISDNDVKNLSHGLQRSSEFDSLKNVDISKNYSNQINELGDSSSKMKDESNAGTTVNMDADNDKELYRQRISKRKAKKRKWHEEISCFTETEELSWESKMNKSIPRISAEQHNRSESLVTNDVNVSTSAHTSKIGNINNPKYYEVCEMQQHDYSASNDSNIPGHVIKVKALDECGKLNIFAYHRGIAGLEPRELKTGRLLCALPPTDTNFGWMGPPMKLKVNISFPLADADVLLDDSNDCDDKMSTPYEQADFGSDLSHHTNDNDMETESNMLSTEESSLPQVDNPDRITPSTETHCEAKGYSLSNRTDVKSRRRSVADRKAIEYKVPYYVDDIEWDLSDPKTVSPMVFAANMAVDYGLTCSQTLDLAASIQKQIDSFVQNNCYYWVPIAARGPNGEDRTGIALQQSVNCTPLRILQGGHRAASILVVSPSISDNLEKDQKHHQLVKDRKSFPPSTVTKQRTSLTNLEKVENVEEEVSQVAHDGKTTHSERSEAHGFTDRCFLVEKARSLQIQSVVGKDVKLIEVVKIPSIDFPREVMNSFDMDPALPGDYKTVFCGQGISHVLDNTSIDSELYEIVEVNETSDRGETIEYCLICSLPGTLTCCDRCPRSFHDNCLEIDVQELPDYWICPRCGEDSKPTDVDGKLFFSPLKPFFSNFDHHPDIDSKITVFSMIAETLDLLIKYDFGSMFSEPVDLKVCTDYCDIIERPMDLGTVRKKLTEGCYFQANEPDFPLSFIAADPVSAIDKVTLEVLRDIETVWHNCFVYNRKGSAVYRMAEVQRQKYTAIKSNNFETKLSNYVQQSVASFIEDCEKKRKEPSSHVTVVRPKSRHHIDVLNSGTNKNLRTKCLAVLNPETNMLTKVYSSLKNAYKAYLFLKRLGHQSGVEDLKENQFFDLVKSSTNDPSLLLFGYRWLQMNQLRAGRVKFRSQNETKPSASLSRSQCKQPNTFVSHCTLKENLITTTSTIVKRCTIAHSVLGTFDNIPSAAKNWRETAKNSLTTLLSNKSEDEIVDLFTKDYLLGSKLVDGVIWRIVNNVENRDPSIEVIHKGSKKDPDDKTEALDNIKVIPAEFFTPAATMPSETSLEADKIRVTELDSDSSNALLASCPVKKRKGKRKIVAINLSSQSVVQRFESMAQAAENLNIPEPKQLIFSKCLSERKSIEGLLYADAGDEEALLCQLQILTACNQSDVNK